MNIFYRQQRGISGEDYESKHISKASTPAMPPDYCLIKGLIDLGVPYERINIPGITFDAIEI